MIMRKLDIEDDGSFGYELDKNDLKELILEKFPNLIDDEHKFDSIDIGRENIAIMIIKKDANIGFEIGDTCPYCGVIGICGKMLEHHKSKKCVNVSEEVIK